MMSYQFTIIPIIIIMGCSLFIAVNDKFRWNVIGLAIQYIAVFWLIAEVWPIGQAAVKLVTGWMACSILGSSSQKEGISQGPTLNLVGKVFRVLFTILIWILLYGIAPILANWFGIDFPILFGGVILIGSGLLNLGISTRPETLIISLLVTLAGFEVIYASLETSVLVTGLLAMVNLSLALVASYIVGSSERENNI